MLLERRCDRGDREDPGGDRDGNRQHVIGQQGSGADEARKRAQIVLCNDVSAAACFVRLHGLPVGSDDDREQRRDRNRDRKDDVSRCRRGRDQHHQRRLGGIGDRRERVGGEDRQRERLRQ